MKIQLPKSFEYHDERGNFAYVLDGILYMSPYMDFEKLMYSMTYLLKGEDVCFYCHKPLHSGNRTIDHAFPRSLGGVSITNNLKPCCNKCNIEKGDLTCRQYQQISKIQSKQRKREATKNARESNLKEIRRSGILIPPKWYELKKEYSVIGTITSDRPSKSSYKYKKLLRKYETYKKICRPVLVSANKFVLDGFMVLFMVKNLEINIEIPFIVLENVVVVI